MPWPLAPLNLPLGWMERLDEAAATLGASSPAGVPVHHIEAVAFKVLVLLAVQWCAVGSQGFQLGAILRQVGIVRLLCQNPVAFGVLADACLLDS